MPYLLHQFIKDGQSLALPEVNLVRNPGILDHRRPKLIELSVYINGYYLRTRATMFICRRDIEASNKHCILYTKAEYLTDCEM